MAQFGLFDFNKRLSHIDKAGDPLVELNKAVHWEQFRQLIELSWEKPKKLPAGAKDYNCILLFKILILQSMYTLSDEETELQILDRYSFSRFLSISEGSKAPNTTTIIRFRDELAKTNVVELLFTQFNQFLRNNGFRARKSQIDDASIVLVPTQHNSSEEKEQIKVGESIAFNRLCSGYIPC